MAKNYGDFISTVRLPFENDELLFIARKEYCTTLQLYVLKTTNYSSLNVKTHYYYQKSRHISHSGCFAVISFKSENNSVFASSPLPIVMHRMSDIGQTLTWFNSLQSSRYKESTTVFPVSHLAAPSEPTRHTQSQAKKQLMKDHWGVIRNRSCLTLADDTMTISVYNTRGWI